MQILIKFFVVLSIVAATAPSVSPSVLVDSLPTSTEGFVPPSFSVPTVAHAPSVSVPTVSFESYTSPSGSRTSTLSGTGHSTPWCISVEAAADSLYSSTLSASAAADSLYSSTLSASAAALTYTVSATAPSIKFTLSGDPPSIFFRSAPNSSQVDLTAVINMAPPLTPVVAAAAGASGSGDGRHVKSSEHDKADEGQKRDNDGDGVRRPSSLAAGGASGGGGGDDDQDPKHLANQHQDDVKMDDENEAEEHPDEHQAVVEHPDEPRRAPAVRMGWPLECDLTQHICSFLPFNSRVQAEAVCRNWLRFLAPANLRGKLARELWHRMVGRETVIQMMNRFWIAANDLGQPGLLNTYALDRAFEDLWDMCGDVVLDWTRKDLERLMA